MKKNDVTALSIDLQNIPEYKGALEKQKELVESNPFIAIEDSPTYEEAKKSRTALRKGRYELQNGEKAIASKLKEFRDFVKEETKILIDITLPYEEKQQKEIDRYEAQKKAEKEEAARIERERIEAHKNTIINFREQYLSKIKVANLETIKGLDSEINAAHFDVEEFQDDLAAVKDSLLESYNEKFAQLKEAEEVRLERERLLEEKKKLNEQRKAQEEEARKQKEKLEEERKAQEQKALEEKKEIDAEKAELEKQKKEQQEKEAARLAEEKRLEDEKIQALNYRKGLIEKVLELSPQGNKEDAEAMSNEGLEDLIKKIEAHREKVRQENLKSDKEKLLTIVKSLRIDYDPIIEIKEKTANNLLSEFVGEADSLMNKYTNLVNNLK